NSWPAATENCAASVTATQDTLATGSVSCSSEAASRAFEAARKRHPPLIAIGPAALNSSGPQGDKIRRSPQLGHFPVPPRLALTTFIATRRGWALDQKESRWIETSRMG